MNPRNTSPTVSIVIPCFNRAPYIGEAIESALEQGTDFEVIVIDDGSTDDSWKIISSFGGIDAFRIENAGPGFARNVGISRSRGQYIKFLDSDDRLPRNSVQEILAYSSGLKEREIAFGDILTIDALGKPADGAGYGFKSQPGKRISRTQLLSGVMTTTLPLFPIDSLKEAGGFNTEIRLGEDMELSLRLLTMGYSFVRFPHVVCELRQHSDHRLSRRFGVKGYRSVQAAFETSWGILSEIQPSLTREERAGFAKFIWTLGRDASRDRLPAEANALFELATQIASSDARVGPAFLQWAYRLTSPYRAERWLEAGKLLFRQMRPTP